MNRIALFAHYDRDGIIDDYVVYYLRGLANVAKRILFISDCELRPGEAAKLDGIAEFVSAGRHGEYDFGSWKRGFEHLNYDLNEWDEVIIANDSCYAPVFPFEDVFLKMEGVSCDFWGPTATEWGGILDHINSYFMVFRKAITSNDKFVAFWRAVAKLETKKQVIINYEIGLTKLLIGMGYSPASVAPMRPVAHFLRLEYLTGDMPKLRLSWLKINMFRDKTHLYLRARSRIKAGYPKRLIDVHIHRMFNNSQSSLWAPWGGNVLALRGKTKNRWWKVYAYVFRIPVFAFAFPVRINRI